MNAKQALATLIIFFGAGGTAYADSIDWEIANRFRSFDYHNGVEATTTSSREAAAKLFADYTGGGKAATVDDIGKLVIGATSPWTDAEAGPWIEDPFGPNPHYDRNFARLPSTLLIRASASFRESAADKVCLWTFEGVPVATRRCSRKFTLEIPAAGGSLTVAMADSDRSVSTLLNPTLRLVAGLGDSYGAGEGSPDVPTAWNKYAKNQGWAGLSETKINQVLVSHGAHWHSVRCNRSFYSYQNMVALWMAARDPHSVVAFLHFSCAGAEIIDGLLAPQRHIPGHKHGCASADPQDAQSAPPPTLDCDAPKSQITALVEALCDPANAEPGVEGVDANIHKNIVDKFAATQYAPGEPAWIDELVQCKGGREMLRPDVVMINIGGNDMGFAGVIGWGLIPLPRQSAVNGPATLGAKLLGDLISERIRDKDHLVCPEERSNICSSLTAKERIADLPKRFAALSYAIDKLVDPRKVVLNTYPNPLHDQAGEICANPKNLKWLIKPNEWDAVRLELPPYIRPERVPLNLIAEDAKTVEDAVVDRLNASLIAAAGTAGWLVGNTDGAFRGGGWCVGGLRQLGRPGDLSAWRAYDDRGRYIQTANDAFRTQWPKNSQGNFLYGLFHPNPWGYAKMGKAAADAIVSATK